MVPGLFVRVQEGGIEIAKSDDTRINDEIRAPRVRLIGVDGSQLGLFDTRDAQRIADDQNLDLVEIAPNADPPVCKVMDYGKFKYQQAMKAKQARKNQSKIEVKEMKFRPKIDVGDYETKKGHVLRFLKKGARVKITIMFRGREMAHPEQGLNVLERLAEDLKPFATVESQPKLEGRNMLMLLAPIKGAFDNEGESEPSDKKSTRYQKESSMPKMKTHSGSKKRFRRSGTGKIMRAKAYKSHILTKKSTKRKRGFRQETELAAADAKVINARLAGR